MPVARTYIPVSPADLRSLAETQATPDGPLTGFAVAPGTGEDGEYAGWLAAASLAREVLGDGQVRRVIVSADLDLTALTPAPDSTPTAVRVVGPVPLRRIVAFHVDERVGGSDADLLWYDVTELEALSALVLDDREQARRD